MKKEHFTYAHICYWLFLWLKELLFGFQTYNFGTINFASVVTALSVKLITLFFPVCIFYVNFFYLVPKLGRKRKIVSYTAALVVLFAVLAPIHQYVYATLLPQHFSWYSYAYLDKLDFWLSFQTLLFENFVYIFFSIAISYVDDYFETQTRELALAKENAVTELAYLKSQINPHFLFNTLNDIYALTYQQATEAPQAIIKLSELLRYMLKESNESFAPLDREIAVLHNVVELYQIGQKGTAFISLQISGKTNSVQIAPLILINFVENAFKHGIVDDPDHPVRIQLDILDDTLEFVVSNRKNHYTKDKTGGIGLANVQRRLALIYPDQHQLDITDQNDTFTVNLHIKNL